MKVVLQWWPLIIAYLSPQIWIVNQPLLIDNKSLAGRCTKQLDPTRQPQWFQSVCFRFSNVSELWVDIFFSFYSFQTRLINCARRVQVELIACTYAYLGQFNCNISTLGQSNSNSKNSTILSIKKY